MSYQSLGVGALSYKPCQYGKSKLTFRGPKRLLERDYIAFVGGTETYGKFIAAPFPELVEDTFEMQSLNLGLPNAGVDAFLNDPFVPVAASDAVFAVVQVMGAQNNSNCYYSVHPRRNDRFIKASQMLRSLYSEVDFAECNFNKHLLKVLHSVSPERFDIVRRELQQQWLERMVKLLSGIKTKIILLWFAKHGPDDTAIRHEFSSDPMFVTRDMIETLRPSVHEIVEVVASPGAQACATSGMVYSKLELPAAAQMMGPIAHQEAAHALTKFIRESRE